MKAKEASIIDGQGDKNIKILHHISNHRKNISTT